MSYGTRSGHGYGSRKHSSNRFSGKTVAEIQNARSIKAKLLDASLKAPVAKSIEDWMAHPNRLDLPDVDMPKEDKETFLVTNTRYGGTAEINASSAKEAINKAIEQAGVPESYAVDLKAEKIKGGPVVSEAKMEELHKQAEEFRKEQETAIKDLNSHIITGREAKEPKNDAEFEKWLETNEAQKAYRDQIMSDNKVGNPLRNWEEFKKIPEAKVAFEKFKNPSNSKIDGATATFNKATGWMALSFSSIPAQEVREEMKANGFRWNPVRKQWVAKWYPMREELAKKYAGEVEQVDIKPNWAAKAEHAAEMAAKHEAKSEQLFETEHKLGDVIPFGQPILVGHYSEKADRNFRNRLENMSRKGVEEHKTAEYYAEKAERYGKKATGESPGLIYRRMQKLEAEKRALERQMTEANEKHTSESYKGQIKQYIDHTNQRLEVEREKYKASGGLAVENVGFKPGDKVVTRFGIGELRSLSKKTARIRLFSATGIYTNNRQESLLSVDDIKSKVPDDKLELVNKAAKEQGYI